MIGGSDSQLLRNAARADMEREATGLLALNVHPTADPAVGLAVPLFHRRRERFQRSLGARKKMSPFDAGRPSRRNGFGQLIGGVPSGYAADAARLNCKGGNGDIALRSHVQEASRAAAQHFRNGQQRTDGFIFRSEMGIERHCPIEHPFAGVDVVGIHPAGKHFRKMHVGVDEPRRHAITPSVADQVAALAGMAAFDLVARTDGGNPVVFDDQ